MLSVINTGLSDLDELVETVRNYKSKCYIIEAVNAYRGGAYRAAIISTWIAVFYDIIQKIETLAVEGYERAINFKKEFHEALSKKKNEKKTYLLKREQKILEEAKSFGFLSEIEQKELELLRQERHYCAHPGYLNKEELFQPTPEIVRAHITHAIVYLLQHEPIYGKKTISRIITEIKIGNLYKTREKICKEIEEENLYKKDKFVKLFVRKLLKAILNERKESTAKKIRTGISYYLLGLKKLANNYYEIVFSEELQKLLYDIDDDKLLRVFWLRKKGERCWENWKKWNSEIREKIIKRLKDILREQNAHEILYEYFIFDSMDLFTNNENEEDQSLKKIIVEKISELDPLLQIEIIERTNYQEFVESAIKIFDDVTNEKDADYVSMNIILPMTIYFSQDQIISIIETIKNNRDVFEADKTPDFALELFYKTESYFDGVKDRWIAVMEEVLKSKGENDKLEDQYARLKLELENRIPEYSFEK